MVPDSVETVFKAFYFTLSSRKSNFNTTFCNRKFTQKIHQSQNMNKIFFLMFLAYIIKDVVKETPNRKKDPDDPRRYGAVADRVVVELGSRDSGGMELRHNTGGGDARQW